MAHEFLSEEWFAAVEALASEAPEPPAAAADLKVNLTVSGSPTGDTEAHLAAGAFGRGHLDGAPTKVTVPYDVARAMFIDGNPQAAMQAFMAGQIKVEGDMTKLMAMQSIGTSPEQAEFQRKLQAITA